MDTDTLVDALEASGLSPYQAAAYVTLLDLRSAAASDVARESDVPQPRIYDVLRDLESAGYVELYDEGTLHARIHDPSPLLRDVRAKATRYEEASEEIEATYRQSPSERTAASVVERFETVRRRTRDAVADASDHVQLCLSPELVDAFADVLRVAHKRGVTVELALHSAPPDTIDPTAFHGVCTELRTRTLSAPFLAIVDQTVVRFALHTGTRNEYGLLVDDRTHAGLFRWYFLTSLWHGWDRQYTECDDSPSVTYRDIRHCVSDLRPALTDGVEVGVRVDGYDVQQGDPVTFTGVVRAAHCDRTADGERRLVQQNGRATVVVDADDRTYTVGGVNAVVEDVRATRITVTTWNDS